MKSFSESGLKSELLTSLERINFISPTPIQNKAISHLMHSDQDLIGTAHTGTGKTAAFALPIIHRTHLEIQQVQSIVLCPTRELCLQITSDIQNYTRDLKGFKVAAVYGGSSMTDQISALKRGVHMVVGTPGRTLDLINRNKLQLHQVRWLVLDEADEMLSMGFKDELDKILAATPSEKQTLLFSATMPSAITSIADHYMTDPVKISVDQGVKTTTAISHGYYVVSRKAKFKFLTSFLSLHQDIYAIIFCRTRKDTAQLAEDLEKEGYRADALHGDLSQRHRDRVLNRFRNRQINLLIATDVAARGLDVTGLSHVINYDLPDEPEAYVHRSGRTGRAGKSGDCLCLLDRKDLKKLQFISRKTGIKFSESRLPDQSEIIGQRVNDLTYKLLEINPEHPALLENLPAADQKLFHLSRQELIGRFLTLLMGDELQRNNWSGSPKKDTTQKSRNNRLPDDFPEESHYLGQFTRFYINLGTKHNLDAPKLISVINRYMKGSDFAIGKIEMLKSFSFFEIEEGFEDRVIAGFRKATFDSLQVVVEKSMPKPDLSKHRKLKGKKKKRK
jgi:ATP-dependent RNA helicase DeaD